MGCSGSGKTTLGRALASRLHLPFIELDAIHHLPGWQERETGDFRALGAEATAADGWVVDGNYQSKLGDLVTDAADTVVWLDFDRPLVMRLVVARTLRRVVTREELWNGNREPWSNLWSRDPYRSIIAWTWQNYGAYRARYDAQADARWIRLRTPAELSRWLAGVAPAAAPGAVAARDARRAR